MSDRDDRAIAAALDTPEGSAALAVMETWGPKAKHTAHLCRRAINRAYEAIGLRAPDLRMPSAGWEPRT